MIETNDTLCSLQRFKYRQQFDPFWWGLTPLRTPVFYLKVHIHDIYYLNTDFGPFKWYKMCFF